MRDKEYNFFKKNLPLFNLINYINFDLTEFIIYIYIYIMCTFKFDLTYFALSFNFSIFSGVSSLMACFIINQGEISALTSSGIFESLLV